MSIVVSLEELAGEIAKRGAGYLLTTTADSRPHILHLSFSVDGTELRAEVGRSAVTNIEAQSAVSLLWPARSTDDYSLIVDGTASISDEAMAVIVASGAVLHRPAP